MYATAERYVPCGVWKVAYLPGYTTNCACGCGFLLHHETTLAVVATGGSHDLGEWHVNIIYLYGTV